MENKIIEIKTVLGEMQPLLKKKKGVDEDLEERLIKYENGKRYIIAEGITYKVGNNPFINLAIEKLFEYENIAKNPQQLKKMLDEKGDDSS